MSRHWPWALSLCAHGVLVLVFVGVGSRTRSDLRARTPVDTIEIEIEQSPGPPAPTPAPPAPPGPASAVPAPPSAVPPAAEPAVPPVRPRPAPAPAQPVPPVRAPAAALAGAPDAPAPPGAQDSADAPAAAAGALSMRSSARAPGPADLLARPAPDRPVIDLSPAQAARMVAPDPGPPASSPLDLPGPPPEQPGVRDSWMPTGGGDYAVASPGFTARIARDGQVTIEDKPSFQLTPRVEVGSGNQSPAAAAAETFIRMTVVTFDVTDWAMRMSGMDPYASAKLRLLDQTREVRAEMRAKARIEDLRDAIALLPRLLDQVWHEPGLPAAERRALLFRIWDECVEIDALGRAGPDGAGSNGTGPDGTGSNGTGSNGTDDGAEPRDSGEPEQDDALARAGRTARATVLGYIRRNLPAGSPDAYTAAEIDALNARRRSAERFVPYP